MTTTTLYDIEKILNERGLFASDATDPMQRIDTLESALRSLIWYIQEREDRHAS